MHDNLSASLLIWYDRNRRHLPWRAAPGSTPDPYHVWLSEIMLQQTGVATVVPYFEKFIRLWRDIHQLADAERDMVLTAWAGLGYYARARNLHKCAQMVSREHHGHFPREMADLLALPGVGPYTAAAIAAIAFDQPAPVLDGNIERVLSRVHMVETPLPGARDQLRPLARDLIAVSRPGDTAQALMDLGSAVCTPRKPACDKCPLRQDCRASAANIADTLPVKARKRKPPTRTGAAFWLTRPDGAILLRRRPDKGLFGGMMGFPCTPWDVRNAGSESAQATNSLDYAPVSCRWHPLPGHVSHVFTHFRLELKLYAGHVGETAAVEGTWVHPGELDAYALPTLMRKIAAHVKKVNH